MSDTATPPVRPRKPRTHNEEFWRNIPILEEENQKRGVSPPLFRKRDAGLDNKHPQPPKKPAPHK